MTIDFPVLDWIQSLRTPFLDHLMIGITRLGDHGFLWIVIVSVLLCIPKTRKVGIVAALALITDAILCNLVIKPLVGRSRPFELVEGMRILIPRPSGTSFPSGHTSSAFSVVFSLLFSGWKKLGAFIGMPAVLIAFSRMYLYVHFPTDIFAGILVGAFCGFLFSWIMKKRDTGYQKKS